jgi:hypothetical protein
MGREPLAVGAEIGIVTGGGSGRAACDDRYLDEILELRLLVEVPSAPLTAGMSS